MILHQYDDQEPCQGMNCGTTTAQHSKECIAEHTAACAGGFFGKWLPIESAPKPSGRLLLAAEGKTCYGHWYSPHSRWEYDGYDFGNPKSQPTHWMPLPPPPVTLNK
jgi:hypothetical protein